MVVKTETKKPTKPVTGKPEKKLATSVVKKPRKKPASRRDTPQSAGRPDLLTEVLMMKIADYIRIGNFARVACGTAGISYATYMSWMSRGRIEVERSRLLPNDEIKATEVKYLKFLEVIEQAKDEATAITQARLTSAAMRGDSLNDRWFLERFRPELYGNREKIDLEHSGSIDVKEVVSMGELEEKVALILKRRKEREGNYE